MVLKLEKATSASATARSKPDQTRPQQTRPPAARPAQPKSKSAVGFNLVIITLLSFAPSPPQLYPRNPSSPDGGLEFLALAINALHKHGVGRNKHNRSPSRLLPRNPEWPETPTAPSATLYLWFCLLRAEVEFYEISLLSLLYTLPGGETAEYYSPPQKCNVPMPLFPDVSCSQ